MALTRRGFLTGVAATAVAAAAPPVARIVAPIGGTVTGRFTSLTPNMQDLTRSQVKAMMFAHSYGAEAPAMSKMMGFDVSHVDFHELERRVLATFEIGAGDPYDPKHALRSA